MKNIIISFISLIFSNSFMQLFLIDSNYNYFKNNISKSNLIPYIFYVLIFIIVYFILHFAFLKIDFDKFFNRINTGFSFIISLLILCCFSTLLYFCYLNDSALFDAPGPDKVVYYNLSWEAFILLVIIALASFIISNNLKKNSSIMHNCILMVISGFVAVFLIINTYFINCFSMYYNTYHTDAYFNSIYNTMQGIPRSDLNTSVYGFYSFLIAPFVKMAGGGYIAFRIVMAGVSFITIICFAFAIVAMCNNNLIKILAIFALPMMQISLSWEIYDQLFPHRVFFPSIILAFIALMIKCNYKNNKKKFIIFQIIGHLICVMSIIWNLEMGIITTVAFTAFNIHFVVGYCFAAFDVIIAWILAGLINLSYGGEFLSIKQFVFPLLNDHYITDTLTIDYQKGIVPWMFVASGALILIGYGIRCVKFFNNSVTKENYIIFRQFCLAAGVIALGQMTYYINRPAWGNIKIVYMCSVLIAALIATIGINTFKKCDQKIVKYIGQSLISMSLTALCFTIVIGIYNYNTTKTYNANNNLHDYSEIYRIEKELSKELPANTPAIGYSIPMLYADLGWDSYYHTTDIADIGVTENNIAYYINLLNKDIATPILIDEATLNYIATKAPIDDFYSRYSKTKTFIIYNTVLHYFTPVQLHLQAA